MPGDRLDEREQVAGNGEEGELEPAACRVGGVGGGGGEQGGRGGGEVRPEGGGFGGEEDWLGGRVAGGEDLGVVGPDGEGV